MRRLGSCLRGTTHRSSKRAVRPRVKRLAIESLEPRGMLSATIDSFSGDVEPMSDCEYADAAEYSTDSEHTTTVGDECDPGCFWGYEYWDDSSYDYGSVDDCWYAADDEFANPYDDTSWYDWDHASSAYASDWYATDVSWDAGEGIFGWTGGEVMTGSVLLQYSESPWEPGTQYSFSGNDPQLGGPVASLSLGWAGQTPDSGYLICSESISPTWQRLGELRFEASQTLGSISTAAAYDGCVFSETSSWPSTEPCSIGGLGQCELLSPAAEDAPPGWSHELSAADGGANFRAAGDLARAAAWFTLPTAEAAGVVPMAGKRRPR